MSLHVIFEVSLAHCLCYAQNLSYLTEGLCSGIKRAVHASCLAWLIDDFVFSQPRSLLVWLLISSYDSTLFFPPLHQGKVRCYFYFTSCFLLEYHPFFSLPGMGLGKYQL